MEIITRESSTCMDFSDALRALKDGKKLQRIGWNGSNMYVVMQKGYPQGIPCNKQTAEAWGINEGDKFVCRPYLQIRNPDDSHSMWVPSVGDILADDWVTVDILALDSTNDKTVDEWTELLENDEYKNREEFGFMEMLKVIGEGYAVTRKGWIGCGNILELCVYDSFMTKSVRKSLQDLYDPNKGDYGLSHYLCISNLANPWDVKSTTFNPLIHDVMSGDWIKVRKIR